MICQEDNILRRKPDYFGGLHCTIDPRCRGTPYKGTLTFFFIYKGKKGTLTLFGRGIKKERDTHFVWTRNKKRGTHFVLTR